jgi:Tfp pilus assembly protein PilF
MQCFFLKNSFVSALAMRAKSQTKNLMSRPRLIALLLALVTLLAYWPVAYCGFVNYDDIDYVTGNRVVQKGLTWEGFRWALTYGNIGHWHPLTWISHMLDCQLYGLSPSGHHLTNILFHTAAVVLLFLVLWRMTGFMWRSAFVAAVFAIHPLRVESVAWVAERKDVLSACFFMLTLGAYVRFVEKSKAQSQKFKVYYGLTLLFFALGLLSKNMLVTTPFVLLLLDYWPLGRFSNFTPQVLRRLVAEKIPLFVLAIGSCVATALVPEQVTAGKLAFGLRMENAVVSYVTYLWQMIHPSGLACVYPNPTNYLPFGQVAGALGLLLAISGAVFVLRKARPWLIVGWLWYLGMMTPVIGIVQISYYAHADRYTYLPQIGLYFAMTWTAANLCARWRHRRLAQAIATASAVLVLAGCLVLTENQLRYWHDSESLFRHTLAVTKDNHVAHLNLGTAFQDEGRLNEALAEYRASAQLAPGYSVVHKNLGSVLDALGRPKEALAEYRLALQFEPNLPALHDGIGIVFVEQGRFDEGMSEFSSAARLDPAYPWPYFQMGKALLQQGRDAEAIGKFREALRINPDNFQILAFFAHVLAADEKPGVRDGQTALVYAARANDLSDGTQPFVLDALGMACAEVGHFDDAREVTQKAIDLAKAAKMKDLEPMQQRLELYRNHQPWRESFLSTNLPPKDLPKK